MSTLILQTALLLLGAYFLGAWLACVIRRSTMAYHAEDGLVTQQSASAGLAASPLDQAARAPVRRAEVVPVAPQMETINRPVATPVTAQAAPVVAAPSVVPKAAPAVAAPAAPVDSVKRFHDVLTGTQKPLAPPAAPLAPAALAPVPLAPAAPAPLAPTIGSAATAAATLATATVATTVAATAKTLTPVAPAPLAPLAPAAPAPAAAVRIPSAPSIAAPFTIPTPGPTRTGVSPPVAAGASAPLAAPAAATVAATPTAASVAIGADDLTRIRAIDSGLHAKLHQLGIRRYADIAAWSPADVSRVSHSLGFQGRIEQENWIEQAQILSRGGETAFARRKDRGEASLSTPSANQGTPKPTIATSAAVAAPLVATVAAVAKPVVAVPPAAPAAAVASTGVGALANPAPQVADRAAFATARAPLPTAAIPVPVSTPLSRPVAAATPTVATAAASTFGTPVLGRDNLQRIGGINAEVERVLNVQGVGKYNQIASWTEKDTTRFDRLLGYEGRIARENWIEQAQILSRNGETAYSRQFDQQHGHKAAVVAATPAPVTLAAVPHTAATSAPTLAAVITAAPLAVATAATAAVAKAASASSSVPEVPRPARLPDSVVDQIRPAPVAPAPMPPVTAAPIAAPLAAPIATAFNTMPAPASAERSDRGDRPERGDRPDRSDWPERGPRNDRGDRDDRPDRTASTTPPQSSATRTGELAGLRSVRSEAYAAAPTAKSGPDDLKRIRGVGVLIERKLNSMGINSYAQVANWTSAEIDRVSQVLDFKGKVERENWVEQARILSAGGQTEFSRRVDRGDDMNKPK
jgi:predicted flap endonuclease-1-like 5' DNA nuclease